MTAPALGTLLAFRLRIRNASTLGDPDGTADALIYSTVSTDSAPYIADLPQGDGSEVDPLTGDTVMGSFTITVIDANPSATPIGLIGQTGGIVTSNLADTQGRQQLLSRRAYIEKSIDNGTTWTLWVAGYVNRIRLVSDSTYEFTIGDSRRLETASTIFTTISRGLDQGTCVLGGPIAGTPVQPIGTVTTAQGDILRKYVQQGYSLSAPPWDNSTHYVPGNVVTAGENQYICIAGNNADPPPDAAHWQVLPPGLVPSGVWSPTPTYAAGDVVVYVDSQAYLAIATVPANTPPPNDLYWIALQAVLLPSWSMVQDYGGVNCVVSDVGHSTPTLKLTLQSGWFKIPVQNPGDPTWRYAVGNSIPADFSSANSLIPALAAQYGMSPVGYGGTYVNPWGAIGLNLPPGVATQLTGGVVDSNPDIGDVGWTIGGIALQITLPNGISVTVGAYPQLYNASVGKNNGRYSSTPVLIYPKSRTILVDWHDFYTLGSDYLPTAPLDGAGNAVGMPPIGTVLKVKAVVVPISQDAPLHIAMHPIDLLAIVESNVGIGYNAANYAAMRTALGDDLILVLLITESMTIADLFTKYIGGPLGVGRRQGEAPATDQWGNTNRVGLYELFTTRDAPTELPDVTWTDADMYGDTGTTNDGLFDLDEQTICQNVVVNSQTFASWDLSLGSSRPLDDVVPINNQANYLSPDFATFGSQQQEYDIPGGYCHALMQGGGLMAAFMAAKSNLIFERYSRGAPRSWLPILGTSPQAALGDLVLVNSQRLPNAATNGRGGSRLVSVIKKTPTSSGNIYLVEDTGPLEQPAPLSPTISLTLDPADSVHVVDCNITNLAALKAQYPNGSLQVQYYTGGSSPPSGDGQLAADLPFAVMVSPLIILPAVPLNTQVWARATARPGGGALASAWSAWETVTTDTPGAITGLTWTDEGDGAGTLSWTNPDVLLNTPIQVWLSNAQELGYSPTPTTVYIDLAAFSVAVGSTQALSALVYDQIGVLIASPTVTWAMSAGGSHASVNASTGTVTGVTVGAATVEASCGSAHGFASVTVTPQVGATLDHVVVTPTTFTGRVGSTVTFTATSYDTTGAVMAGRTYTWTTSAGSFSGAVLTLPGSPNAAISVHATDSGVNSNTCTGSAVANFNNLAQAARAAGLSYYSVMNQNYPNDNFALVAGVQNTALNLPPLKSQYGTFTVLGKADGRPWQELVDTNGVYAFAAGATATSANQAGIAALATQMYWVTRVRVDEVLALGLSTGMGLLAIGSSPTANKKVEIYCQKGTTQAVQFTAAFYGASSVRNAFPSTSFIPTSNLPPSLCWLNIVAFADTSGAGNCGVYVYDDNGTLLGSNTATLTTALNTDGGANGVVMLNQAFNAIGVSRAAVYGGLSICSGTMPAAPTRWQEPNALTSGLIDWYAMNNTQPGDLPGPAVSTVNGVATFGSPLTVSGTVNAIYDNGGPLNWGLFGQRPGGCTIDETGWEERFFVSGFTSPTQGSFTQPFAPTINKSRSLGIRSKAYLLEGAGFNSVYGSVVNSKTACQQALTALVNGVVGGAIATWGTAQQGGISEWNINEFIDGGAWQAGTWQQYFPGSATTSGWVGYVASLIYAKDPSAKLVFNFNNIHGQSNASQKAAALAFVANLFTEYPAIPTTSVIIGAEFHTRNDTGVSASDASAWATFQQALKAAGVFFMPSEYDVTDTANNGSGAAGRPARELLNAAIAQQVFSTAMLGDASSASNLYGLGFWGLSSLVSWINANALGAQIERQDGDFEETSLLDENYAYFGGPGSSSDVYGIAMSFLQVLAA